jgi:hypothetical protein
MYRKPCTIVLRDAGVIHEDSTITVRMNPLANVHRKVTEIGA